MFTALASRNGANGPFSLVKLAIEHNGRYAHRKNRLGVAITALTTDFGVSSL